MGIKRANPIPAFLPRDNSFRVQRLIPTADIPGLMAHAEQLDAHVDNLYEMVNEISAETERRVGLMRNSFTRANYLMNGWFRQSASGVPRKWTSAGAGVTFSIQAERTNGLFDGNAARIAAGANAGTLTQVVTGIGVGTKWSLTGWVKITTGSGVITVTPNGTNPVIMRFPFSATNYGTGWFCFPSQKAAVGHIELPNDATQITIELKADINSTVDFSEMQLGPGTVGYPTMYVRAPEDITEIVQIGTLPSGYGTSGQQLTTDGAGTLSWADSDPGAYALIKAANEQVTNSTTLQDDNHLLVPIAASESQVATFTIKVGAATTATGIKVACTVPSGAVIALTATMTDTGGGVRTGFASTSGGAIDFTTGVFAADDATITITANVANSTNAGNIQLQWAQSTSIAAPLLVYAGSSVTAIKV